MSTLCSFLSFYAFPNARFVLKLYWILAGLMTSVALSAQVQGLEEGAVEAHTIQRLYIKTNTHGLLTPELHPLSREALAAWAMDFDGMPADLSPVDRRELYRIYKNNNEWLVQPGEWEGFSKQRLPIDFTDWEGNQVRTPSHVHASSLHARYILTDKPVLKYFYRTPAHLFEYQTSSFYIKANPMLNLRVGRDASEGFLFQNQRGVRIRGGVDERVYFASEIIESQARYPEYVRRYTQYHRALPGNGLYKGFNSALFDSQNAYDFLNAQAHIGFRFTPSIHMQFGHGRHFIGHGYRSLLLSDFSNNYLYLKFLTQLGRFYYQNIFAELSAFSANAIRGDNLVPKKYMAAHYLGLHLLPNLSVGLFEAVIFNRSRHFELQYLNPVIFYRSVEHLAGSPDNVLIGLNADWRLLRRFQLYGQFVLDEFKLNELVRNNRGWHGNKFGVQAGVKAVDVAGIRNLDLQAEFNTVRPYTYQHWDSLNNYTHYNMPLAHPLGANFREYISIARYQPAYRWILEGRYIYMQTGRDEGNRNYGSDILRTYRSRVMDFGNRTGQGVDTRIAIVGLHAQYELFHQFYLEMGWFHRREQTPGLERTLQYWNTGIRWNMAERRMDF
jgi:hypothetical protein